MTKFDSAFDHRYSVAPRSGSKSMGNIVDGGTATARVKTPSTAAERAAREADQRDALAYLTRKGLDDVAEILGLTGKPRKRSQTAVLNGRAAATKPCAQCEEQFTPHNKYQRTCSKACGRKQADATRRRHAAEASAAVRRPCPVCGKDLAGKPLSQKTCSVLCGRNLLAAHQLDARGGAS